jgi:hypothetical protein
MSMHAWRCRLLTLADARVVLSHGSTVLRTNGHVQPASAPLTAKLSCEASRWQPTGRSAPPGPLGTPPWGVPCCHVLHSTHAQQHRGSWRGFVLFTLACVMQFVRWKMRMISKRLGRAYNCLLSGSVFVLLQSCLQFVFVRCQFLKKPLTATFTALGSWTEATKSSFCVPELATNVWYTNTALSCRSR